jgi:hypothetical protein
LNLQKKNPRKKERNLERKKNKKSKNVDRTVEKCGEGSHIRNRLELARATWNNLYRYLLKIPEQQRFDLIARAYTK